MWHPRGVHRLVICRHRLNLRHVQAWMDLLERECSFTWPACTLRAGIHLVLYDQCDLCLASEYSLSWGSVNITLIQSVSWEKAKSAIYVNFISIWISTNLWILLFSYHGWIHLLNHYYALNAVVFSFYPDTQHNILNSMNFVYNDFTFVRYPYSVFHS